MTFTETNAPKATISNGLRKDKHIPDYYGDRYWANVLAKRIQNYWHKRGMYSIKAWVEEVNAPSGAKYFNVRSNISYKVPFDLAL